MNRLIVILLLLISQNKLSIAMENKQSVLKSKPYFTLSIKASNAPFIASINGNTVLEYYEVRNISTAFPINHWMMSGDNEIELLVQSLDDVNDIQANVLIEIAIQVQDESKLNEPAIKLADIKFDGELHVVDPSGNATSKSMGAVNLNSENGFRVSQSGEVKLQKIFFEKYDKERHFYRIKRKVMIPSSLPRWAFFDSDDIPDISESSMSDEQFDKFLHSIYVEYVKVFDAIKNKNISQVIPMFSERNKELDAAFYYAPGTMEKKIQAALEDAANDEDAELLGFKQDYFEFEIFDNKKLARLIRADDSKAIVQNFKKAQGSQSFDLIFRYKNGKWILTR